MRGKQVSTDITPAMLDGEYRVRIAAEHGTIRDVNRYLNILTVIKNGIVVSKFEVKFTNGDITEYHNLDHALENYIKDRK